MHSMRDVVRSEIPMTAAGRWAGVGGTTGLFDELADNNGGGTSLLPWQDATYVQSPLNPSSAEFVVGLQGMSPPDHPRLGQVIIPFRAYLNTGTSLTLTVQLFEGTTLRYSQAFTITATTPTGFTATPDPTSLSHIVNWSNLRLKFIANGTGQIRVTWARLTQLPVRSPLPFSNATPASVVADLLGNEVGLPGRYRGPGLEGIPGLDTGTTLVLAKTIAAPIGGNTDLTIAKQELDAVGFVAGGFFTSSQGRVVFKQLFDVSVDSQGATVYTPRTGRPPLVTIPAEEVAEPIMVTPGFRYRVPEWFLDWGFNPDTDIYHGEARGVHTAALTSLGVARIVALQRASPTVAQWVPSQGLANGLTARHVTVFGLGLLVWRFRSAYAYPELELGDPIAIRSDRFVAFDPIANGSITGPQWVIGLVVGTFDIWGRDLAIWIPTYASTFAVVSNPGTGVTPFPGHIIPVIGDSVTNGSFESQLVGWTTLKDWAPSNLYISVDIDAYQGAAAIKFDRSGGGTGQSVADLEVVQTGTLDIGKPFFSGSAFRTPLLISVAPGTTMRIAGAGKWDLTGSAGTLFGRVFCYFYDVNFTNVSVVAGPSWSAETTYTPKTATVTVPATAAYMTIAAGIDGIASGTGGIFWIDEVHAMASY